MFIALASLLGILILIAAFFLINSRGTNINNPTNLENTIESNEAKYMYMKSLKILENLANNTNRGYYKIKITLTLNNLLFDNQLKVLIPIQQFIGDLKRMIAKYDFYFITNVNNITNAQALDEILANLKTAFPPHRILGCQTKEGLIGMIRQLNPRIHVENEPAIIEALIPHAKQLLINSSTKNKIKEEVFNIPRRSGISTQNYAFMDTFAVFTFFMSI